MNRYADFVIKHRKIITAVFVLAAVAGLFLRLGVKVNYNLVDYLPSSAPSTKALEIMNEEFDQSIPNASVMVRDVSLTEALQYKERLNAIDGVSSVIWLDDVLDVKVPLETQDSNSVEEFYKDGNALFSVTIDPGIETKAVNAIREVIGEGNAITGEAPDKSYMESAAESEVLSAVVILLPIILIILILSTTSWLEPLLFLIAIGVSILLNMGTNVFFGEISFVTNSVSPILQLAVSLDYAIFLLHSFADYRKECKDVEEAMRLAIKKSASAVAASATTTLFGFIALVFMEMGIGADLGINLAKGILFSFVSCMVFLPALTLCVVKLLDKSRHRDLLPSFSNVNRFLRKLAFPALVLVLILVVPGYLGQASTEFTYGMTDENPESRNWQENH
ncbi:MAG: MMPL family transporter, partial [Synergistaceae bacterium]|nr:MMPL family transporter [Synergistaceae bacterium]